MFVFERGSGMYAQYLRRYSIQWLDRHVILISSNDQLSWVHELDHRLLAHSFRMIILGSIPVLLLAWTKDYKDPLTDVVQYIK